MATRVTAEGAPGSQPVPIDDIDRWFQAFSQPTVAFELLALLLCGLLAFGFVWLLRPDRSAAHDLPDERYAGAIWFGRRGVDGVIFPLLFLLLAYLAQLALAPRMPLAVMRVALPALLALAVIRGGVKVLQVTFPQASWVRPVERSMSWLAWAATVLWVSGLLPVVLNELDEIRWTLGGSTVSVRTLLEGFLTAGAVLILSLWVSSAIEARLLRSVQGNELSLRKALSNATRAVLLFVGLMVALTSVGIDLTALSVLGGAVGVGIGLGLQKLAANYVSGYVILTERSMRIGDSVRVDNFEGRITDIKTRYTVIRSLTGSESIVPNEMLITSRVENLSLADRRVWTSTLVSVAYDSDVDRVIRLLEDAALAESRVLRDPGPAAALSAFGADGLEFTLGYWIADPENGQLGLRSSINLRVLRAFREEGIEIPFPQRVLHMVASSAALPSDG